MSVARRRENRDGIEGIGREKREKKVIPVNEC
jgi:hypothetical protein